VTFTANAEKEGDAKPVVCAMQHCVDTWLLLCTAAGEVEQVWQLF